MSNHEAHSQNSSSINLDQCLRTLEQLNQQPELLAQLPESSRIALLKAAGQLARPHREELKLRQKAVHLARRKQVVQGDRDSRSRTGIREARRTPVFMAPPQITFGPQAEPESPGELKTPRDCYVCKAKFTKLHHFYDSMCTPCGDLNYQKRFQSASLEGRIAVITGSRLKIGYHATLMMLRAGARVIATTRFPVDSALRFAREADYSEWAHRLEIYGLDLRHTPSVEIFTAYLNQKLPRLDILINNAAQTVRRPPGFFAHLMEQEMAPWQNIPKAAQTLLESFQECKSQVNSLCLDGAPRDSSLPVAWSQLNAGMGILASAQLSQVPYSFDSRIKAEEVFPVGQLDADLQQVDLRETNSWRYKLTDVPTPELLEVQLINAVAPFVLSSKLTPLMRRDFTGEKHIVNVTAMEGKFYRFTKPDRHPHTNMAKAALNMLTHTSASDLEKDGIYMNAVDTGWVTDEDPAQISQKNQSLHDFQPPLDIVDGAARICDPFFSGMLTGHHWCGKFLKDYQPIDW
jgi:NAD(P)-dependent dehydrogenase (short-subunit alcohol dehydrogenase family)